MNEKLILRSQTSPYGDITKGSVLSHADVDNNFINLKGAIVYTATSENGLVTFYKMNGEDFSVNVGAITSPALSAVTAAGNTTTDDIEITDFTKGVILRSPDNTRWRITVDNSGSLITTIVP